MGAHLSNVYQGGQLARNFLFSRQLYEIQPLNLETNKRLSMRCSQRTNRSLRRLNMLKVLCGHTGISLFRGISVSQSYLVRRLLNGCFNIFLAPIGLGAQRNSLGDNGQEGACVC